VLRAFLEAQPRPREIFFTAIAYDDEDGHGPVLALPLSQLVAAAPSVPIASDYTVQGLARSFGMALDRLVRHEGTLGVDAYSMAAAHAPGAPSRWSATGAIRVAAMDDDDERAPATSMAAIDADGFDRDEPLTPSASAYTFAYDDDGPVHDERSDGGGPSATAAAAEIEYDDGFGSDDDDHPIGAEPAELPDDDYATSYGDEADDPQRRARDRPCRQRPSSRRCSRASRRRSTGAASTRWRGARTRASASASARSISAPARSGASSSR
jgi:hypothetical protein